MKPWNQPRMRFIRADSRFPHSQWETSLQSNAGECIAWASYQICKTVGCACTGNVGNNFLYKIPVPRRPCPAGNSMRFLRHCGLAIPTCITERARRTCRDTLPGSLTSGFLWSRWRRKRSRHSGCMRNPQFYVSGKRPVGRSTSDQHRFSCCLHKTSLR